MLALWLAASDRDSKREATDSLSSPLVPYFPCVERGGGSDDEKMACIRTRPV